MLQMHVIRLTEGMSKRNVDEVFANMKNSRLCCALFCVQIQPEVKPALSKALGDLNVEALQMLDAATKKVRS